MKKADILIIGSGMAGLSLAALLAQHGLVVMVVDREDPAAMAAESFDVRTVALSAGSRDILQPLGIWDEMVRHAAPITSIDVQEGHDPFLLNFQAGETASEAFGWIFPNHVVRGALYEAALNHGVKFVQGVLKNISGESVTAILQSGDTISAQLLIGADGRFSRVRDLIGVDGITLPYHQAAWVGMVVHEHPHQGLAVERFYDTGPFAVLPFIDDAQGRHRSAIVWTQDLAKHQKTLAVPDLPVLTAQLKSLFDDRYGAIEAVGKWASYPLSLYHAKQMTAARVALISDAAHAIHPIAGQGLNLGMRDVAVLCELLVAAREAQQDLGSPAVLEAYQRRRRADVFAMVAATDLLNRLFGTKLRSVRWLRSAGLGLVDKIPALKDFFMRTAMGK